MGFRFRKRLRITEASIIATSPVFNRTFAISPWMVIAIDGSPRLRHRLEFGSFSQRQQRFVPTLRTRCHGLLRIGRGHIGLQLWHEGTPAENPVTMTDLTEAWLLRLRDVFAMTTQNQDPPGRWLPRCTLRTDPTGHHTDRPHRQAGQSNP